MDDPCPSCSHRYIRSSIFNHKSKKPLMSQAVPCCSCFLKGRFLAFQWREKQKQDQTTNSGSPPPAFPGAHAEGRAGEGLDMDKGKVIGLTMKTWEGGK